MALLKIHEPGETPLPHEDERQIAVGIDLGTTNSVVAISNSEKPEVLRDKSGGNAIVPSVVYYGDDTPVVGEAARDQINSDASRVVSSVKRLMGRGLEDVKSVAGTLPYHVEVPEKSETENGEPMMVRLNVGNRVLTPVEVSADILRALRARAEESLDKPVEKAVITVPAYFDDGARTATKDAAKLAGLEVLRLVNEPTAAALAYGLDNGAEGLYAVYDLGGGTFDISLLKMQKGVFQVKATGGDAALGGDDFDHAIAEHLLAERKDGGATDDLDASDAKRLLKAARTVKEYIRVGISPRVHFHIEAVARTFAFFNGDLKVTPDHIKAVARPVLAHRLVLREGMEFSVDKEELLEQILRDMEVPPWK